MFGTSRPPREPLPPGQRTAALWQGAAGVVGGVAIFTVVALATSRLAFAAKVLLPLAFFGALAFEVFGVWKLGIARDGRWDARGFLALALMLPGYPLVLFFVTWTVIAIYHLVTGQRFVPFGG